MFVGFIAVVVILLVIVGLMAISGTKNSQNSNYITEAKKVHAMLSNLEAESKYYLARSENNDFAGIDTNYLVEANFAPSHMVVNNPGMNSADWSGWPTGVDGGFPDPYTGPYLKIGGTAGDDMRIVIAPINNGKNMGIFIMKKKVNNIPPEYTKILEKELANDANYIGG